MSMDRTVLLLEVSENFFYYFHFQQTSTALLDGESHWHEQTPTRTLLRLQEGTVHTSILIGIGLTAQCCLHARDSR